MALSADDISFLHYKAPITRQSLKATRNMASCNPSILESLSLSLLSFLFFTLLLASLNFYALNSISTGTVDQADALLKWKATLNNQSQSVLHSWTLLHRNATNSSLRSHPWCSWIGIACDQRGIITDINLPSMGLQGMVNNFPIPSFPALTTLNLTNNKFLGTVPSNIANLSVINYLDLSMNQFSGLIPYEICLLTSLKILFLDQNNFNGSIPNRMGRLKDLTILALYSNNLSGFIPESLGTIPQEIGNLKKLNSLSLESNNLVGVHGQNGTRSQLRFLICASMIQLHGEFSTWGQCQNLQALRMAGNNITGKIPLELGMLTQLHFLDLSSNHLYGDIPKEFGELTSLLNLSLSGNQLSGSLPLEVGRLSSLTNLDLSSNSLSGKIPKET
ncbi:probable leucine-rich repeat receptor-like protein kinase At1g35710 [Macadamia integrifolia]|uniref:probable leucine-rich repeat receptor-like protein kinase At1g35710 n=1 Tax=Macadamia integrifolia TaxID=60698 RepID=UPI001C4FC5DB|nr:probable leucine-rich repeat receptor-like protein kinase At1g35710 [Macadamia integrifolia]